jgi:hypothetical protein
MILKPDLKCKNKITATEILAVPVLAAPLLTNRFSIIDCRFQETQNNRQKNLKYTNSVWNG